MPEANPSDEFLLDDLEELASCLIPSAWRVPELIYPRYLALYQWLDR